MVPMKGPEIWHRTKHQILSTKKILFDEQRGREGLPLDRIRTAARGFAGEACKEQKGKSGVGELVSPDYSC